jgi:hypothetical protein
LTARACTDLQILGGVYAAQAPALIKEAWQTPVLALIAAERHRLGLDARPTNPPSK